VVVLPLNPATLEPRLNAKRGNGDAKIACGRSTVMGEIGHPAFGEA
jgi:hypothetical protein